MTTISPPPAPRAVIAPDCAPYASTDGNWVTDLFLLPNTSLRLELRDMYRALETLAQRSDAVSESDLDAFFKWWKNFVTFVHELHDVEERVVHAFLGREYGYDIETLNTHVHILLEMNAISNIALQRGRAAPHVVVRQLIVKLEDFGKRLLISRQRKENELGKEMSALAGINKYEEKLENEYWKAAGRTKGYAGAAYLRGVLWAANHQEYWRTPGVVVEPRMLKLRGRVTVLRVTSFLKPHKNALKGLLPPKEALEESEEEKLFFSFA